MLYILRWAVNMENQGWLQYFGGLKQIFKRPHYLLFHLTTASSKHSRMPKPDAAAAISTTSFQHSSLTLILLSFFPIFHLLCTSWAGTVKIHVFTSNQETLFKCKYSCLDVHFIDLLALIVMANVCWAAFCAHSPQDMCCIIALRKLLHSYSHEHYSYTVIFLLNQAENTIRTE